MTKSTITRERLAKIKSWRETYGAGSNVMLPAEEAEELARMALAAMDSDPVAWLLSGGGAENVVRFDSGNAYADPLREVTPLYRHAQPALVVPKEMTAGIAVKYWEGGRGSIESFVAGYNFCRAAMLAAAPHEVK